MGCVFALQMLFGPGQSLELGLQNSHKADSNLSRFGRPTSKVSDAVHFLSVP